MASIVVEEPQAEVPVARVEEVPISENVSDNDRTFPLDVASPGADLLRSTVKTKLSEFMGSYTDDVLAEYVVVLVGHGKQRKQATADLEAFLGIQSEAFVSWLWEHLTANLNDYTQTSEPSLLPDSVKPEVTCEKKEEDPLTEKTKEEDPLTEKTNKESGHEERRQELKRSRSPEPWSKKRKLRTEIKEQKVEGSPPKESPSESAPRLRASRRLLEFAVRDAVGPSGSTSRKVTADAVSKRLRSVVSTEEKAHPDTNGKLKPRPVIAKQTKSMPAMMVALKAAAAAAEDVSKKPAVKPVNRFKPSIWDRVGDKDDGLPDRQSLEDAEHEITEKMEQVHVNKTPRNAKASERHMRRGGEADRRAPSDVPMHYTYTEDLSEQQFERRIEEVPESRKESKRHGIKKDRRHRKPEDYRRLDVETKQKDVSVDRKIKSADVENEKRMDLPNGKDQDLQDVTEMKKRMRQVEMEVTKLRTKQDEVAKVSEKATSAITPSANPPNAPAVTVVKPPVEDADSRTAMVTNVHFATTKEAIAAHFASCGDVAKVTILTDVSGKPKGSAHVEFSSKEGCDKALAMNESCLLSRPLRVVRKDANVAESSTPVVRAPLIRPVRMPIRAFPRAAAFMRASPYLLRPPPPRLVRPPFPVAPHLQWKRDSAGNQTTAMKNGFRSNVGPIRKRSLSYVRPVAPPTPAPEPPPALTSSAEEQKVSG